jgi:hypothetical protein
LHTPKAYPRAMRPGTGVWTAAMRLRLATAGFDWPQRSVFPSVIVSCAQNTTRNGREPSESAASLGMAGDGLRSRGSSGNLGTERKPPAAGETAGRSWRPLLFYVHTVYCPDEHHTLYYVLCVATQITVLVSVSSAQLSSDDCFGSAPREPNFGRTLRQSRNIDVIRPGKPGAQVVEIGSCHGACGFRAGFVRGPVSLTTFPTKRDAPGAGETKCLISPIRPHATTTRLLRQLG